MDAYGMARAAGAFGVADELERLKVEYAAAMERGMRATAELQGKLAEAHAKVVSCYAARRTAKVGFAQSCDDAREVRHALVARVAEVERLRAALRKAKP